MAYLWLDATYLKVRDGGRIVSAAAIIAVAVSTEGRREIIGLGIAPSEAEPFWSGFLKWLVKRGLKGVKLVISDVHDGLRRNHPRARRQLATVSRSLDPKCPGACFQGPTHHGRCRPEVSDNDEELPDDISDEKYISIPDKRELNLGKPLAFGFAGEFLPVDYDEVRHIFSRRGAYRRYRDLLVRRGALERWYDFSNKSEETALRKWCAENGIELSET